jgi:mono/diheme cytochrome c family protein
MNRPRSAGWLKLRKKKNPGKTVSGKEIYSTYCAVCHKSDLKGEEGMYPSLLSLKSRLSEEQALTRIRDGAGKNATL